MITVVKARNYPHDAAIVAYTAAAKGSYSANSGIIELGNGVNDQKIAYSIHCGTWGGATATSYVRVSGYLTPAA